MDGSLDLRSPPSCVVPFVYGPGCSEHRELHYSVYAWVFWFITTYKTPKERKEIQKNNRSPWKRSYILFWYDFYWGVFWGNDECGTFPRLLSVCPGSFRGFDRGPVWVATGFKVDVLLFSPPYPFLRGHGLSLMAYAPEGNESQIASIDLCVSVFCSPQCWGCCLLQCVLHGPRQTDVSSDISQCELDVTVHSIYMLCEDFHFPCCDFDLGVVHIPEPVAWSSSRESNQGSALNLFHVEVGHYWRGIDWCYDAALKDNEKFSSELLDDGTSGEFS